MKAGRTAWHKEGGLDAEAGELLADQRGPVLRQLLPVGRRRRPPSVALHLAQIFFTHVAGAFDAIFFPLLSEAMREARAVVCFVALHL